MTDNYFTALYAVDCSKHTERKGGFTYLSWPFAVAELVKRHPDATWEVAEYDGKPYSQTPAGCFVKVSVSVNGITRAQVHPILNNNNKTVADPDAFQVNTSIQRALVKAIALHGLGLYIYAGEDLPDAPEELPAFDSADTRKAYVEGITAALAANDAPGLKQIRAELNNAQLEDLWDAFSASERRRIKELLKEAT